MLLLKFLKYIYLVSLTFDFADSQNYIQWITDERICQYNNI